FVISFWTRSFLVFYFGFLALLFYINLKEQQCNWRDINFNLILKICYKNIFFFLLPFIFYFFDRFFVGKPTGVFSHYNEFLKFNFHDASLLLEKLWQTIVYGFFWPIIQPLAILQRKIFAVLFMALIIPLYLFFKKEFDGWTDNKAGISYVLIGAFLFFIGFFPYLLVGKAPLPFSGGNTMRHAVLLPLGSSFMILGFFNILFKERWRLIIFSSFFSLLIVSNIFNYFLIDMDSYKQTVVMEELSKLDSAKKPSDNIIVIDDKMKSYNWGGRSFSQYEYEGYIMKINNGDLITKPISLEKYVSSGCPDEPISYVKIYSTSSFEPIVKDWIYLKINGLFGNPKIELDRIANTLGIKVSNTDFYHGLPTLCQF
ncbi:MAG: hypothetical protein Q8P20_07115, partial [bacterium]|nr:hypothetical protein [bacterium]